MALQASSGPCGALDALFLPIETKLAAKPATKVCCCGEDLRKGLMIITGVLAVLCIADGIVGLRLEGTGIMSSLWPISLAVLMFGLASAYGFYRLYNRQPEGARLLARTNLLLAVFMVLMLVTIPLWVPVVCQGAEDLALDNDRENCASATAATCGMIVAETDLTTFAPDTPACLSGQGITWTLAGADTACPTGSGNVCGIHIHTGTSCDDASAVGGHLFADDLMDADPWTAVRYSADGAGASSGQATVNSGLADVAGRAMVVHDSTGSGARVACGIIGADGSAVPSFSSYPGYTGSLTVTGSMTVTSTCELNPAVQAARDANRGTCSSRFGVMEFIALPFYVALFVYLSWVFIGYALQFEAGEGASIAEEQADPPVDNPVGDVEK